MSEIIKITGSIETIEKEYDKFFNHMDKFCTIDAIEETEIDDTLIIEFDSLPLGAIKYIESNENMEIVK